MSIVGALWLVATLTFIALRLLPGDAITAQLIGSGASSAQIAARQTALGLDQPLGMQYVRWLSGLLSGDLGVSLLDGQPVSAIIARQLPPTLSLAVSALLVASGLGIGLGCAAGIGSRLATFTLNIALSAPIYWTGTLTITVFAALLGWFPASGDSVLLPALVLGFSTAGAIGRVTAANIMETRHAEFVMAARAKGLSEIVILWRHVIRVSLPPTIQVIALQAGFLLGGVVITEALFIRPGIGRVLLDAVMRQDYPVVQGLVLWNAVSYIGVTAAAEVIVRFLDPRVAA